MRFSSILNSPEIILQSPDCIVLHHFSLNIKFRGGSGALGVGEVQVGCILQRVINSLILQFYRIYNVMISCLGTVLIHYILFLCLNVCSFYVWEINLVLLG